MDKNQVPHCVNMIMKHFPLWKPEDFRYCFDRVLLGDYGKDGLVLDRMDTSTILKFMKIHDEQRMNEAQSISERNHEEIKRNGIMDIHPKIVDAFKAAIPENDLNTPLLPPLKPVNRMSPFELELHKHFKRFDELQKNFPANEPGDIEPMMMFEGKKVNAPVYVKIMIEKTTGKTL